MFYVPLSSPFKRFPCSPPDSVIPKARLLVVAAMDFAAPHAVGHGDGLKGAEIRFAICRRILTN